MSFNKLIHTITFVLFSIFVYGGNNISKDTDFEKANLLYQNGEFEESLLIYEDLIEKGFKSENLFYNMANAYYKTGSLGKSILYYEKILKINPNNKNAIHNLRFVNTKIEDQLEVLPDLFFIAWWKSLIRFFSANSWAWIAIVFSWFSVIAFGFYLFSKKILFKKAGLIKAFVFGFISFLSMVISGIRAEKIFKKEEIVLIKKSTYGKDAPNVNGANQDLFYEGTKLEVVDKVKGFYKVKSSEGITVWVSSEDFLEI